MGVETSISWTQHTYNPIWGCTEVSLGCDNCLTPDTPILYADMVWRPIGAAQVGDSIIGFDEYAIENSRRKLRPATIERVLFSKQPLTNLVTEHGDIGTTAEHRWLRKLSHHWVPTNQLKVGRNLRYIPTSPIREITQDYRRGYLSGMTEGDGTFRYIPGQRSDKLGFPQAYWRVALTDEDALGRLAAYLSSFGVEANIRPFAVSKPGNTPMQKVEVRALGPLSIIHNLLNRENETPEFMRGWVAGFFDAEGESSHTNLRVSQIVPEPLFRFKRYASNFGFSFDYEPWENHTDTLRMVGGVNEKLRFFSVFTPGIMRKQHAAAFGRQCETLDSKLLAVEKTGRVRDVVDIQTSTRTFWAAGMMTHNCYARVLDARWGESHWGKGVPRREFGDKHWAEPLKWDKDASRTGVKAKVFCASMADVMDDDWPDGTRERLWELIDNTPNLIWQLLTKRPHRYHRYLPAAFKHRNVWLGTSVEDQHYYDIRWPILAEMRQRTMLTTFISYEPALGPLTLKNHAHLLDVGVPDWVIAGGESGTKRRSMKTEWFTSLKQECEELDVSFWLKQMSARTPEEGAALIPAELLLRQFPA